MKILAILTLMMFASCVQHNKSVDSLSDVDGNSNHGYISVDFNGPDGIPVALKVRREADGEWFSFYINNPATPRNTISIFGNEVWSEDAGPAVTIPYAVIPMETGIYIVKQSYAKNGKDREYISTKEDTISVHVGEITHLGKYSGKIKKFLGIFPYGYAVTQLDYSKDEITNLFKSVPVRFTSIFLE